MLRLNKYGMLAVMVALTVVVLTLMGCSGNPTGASLTGSSVPATVSAPATGSAPAAAHVQVKITAKGFSPASVTVSRGGRVVWSNEDKSVHGVMILGGPTSGTLKAGAVASHIFDKPGTFDIADPLHPELKAVVIVK